jgi:hypothetical protein
MKRVAFISLVILWAGSLVSCTLLTSIPTTPTPNQNPKIISYPKPWLNTEMIEFERIGNCKFSSSKGTWYCGTDSPLYNLGCEELQVNNQMGGLSPYPIARCENYSKFIPGFKKQTAFGDFWYSWSYVIYDGTSFVLILTPEDFKKYYAPIESSDEAVSYVEAVTPYRAEYNSEEFAQYFDYYVNEIELTHVEETNDGYIVHVFAYDHPGSCGTLKVSGLDVLVTRAGEIQQKSNPRLIYTVEMCVD